MKLLTASSLASTFLILTSIELNVMPVSRACSIKPQGMIPGKYYASCSDDNYREIPIPSTTKTGITDHSINQSSAFDFHEGHIQTNNVRPQPNTSLDDLIAY